MKTHKRLDQEIELSAQQHDDNMNRVDRSYEVLPNKYANIGALPDPNALDENDVPLIDEHTRAYIDDGSGRFWEVIVDGNGDKVWLPDNRMQTGGVSADAGQILTTGSDSKPLFTDTQYNNLIQAILVHNNHVGITSSWDSTNNQIILRKMSSTTGLPYGTEYDTSNTANIFLGTPAITKTSSGRIIASHAYFGSATTNNTTAIFYSDDNGDSWTFSQNIVNMFWGKLFLYNGDIYIIGTSGIYGAVTISKSTNNGLTWTNAVTIIASEQSGWHTSSTNVIIKDGYVVTAFEVTNGTNSWAKHFQSTLILGDVTDLMNPTSWTRTNIVPFDVTQLPANISPQADGVKYPPASGIAASKGFLEGNIVEKQDGSLVILLRAETNPNSNYAVLLSVAWDNVTPINSTIGSTHTYIEMPGGNLEFNIRYDSITDKFWSVTNHNRYRQFSDQRLEGWLISSSDLVNWQIHYKVVGFDATTAWESEIMQLGAQYNDIVIDGNNLIIATRLADENADDWHNANKAVFTTVEDFRNIPVSSIPDVSLLIDETSEVISDANGIAVIHDKSIYGNSAFMLNADNANKPTFNNGIQFSGSEYLRVKHHRKIKPASGFSYLAVIENLQTNAGERLFSCIGNVADFDNQEGDFSASPQSGLGIQNTYANYTTLLPTGSDYIFGGSFDAVNGHIYNFLNGVNRGQPPAVSGGTWNSNKVVLSTPYVDNNHSSELRLGGRDATSALYFNGLVKALHIFPTFKTESEMIAYMNILNAKYTIY